MLFAAYIGAFLGSVLILAAFSYVLPRLFKEECLLVDRHPPSGSSQPVVVEPKVATAASAPLWVGLAISDVVEGATLLEGQSGVLLRVEGA